MAFISFLFYLFSTFSGVAVITLATSVFLKYKKEILKDFILLISSLFLIQLGLLLNIFIKQSSENGNEQIITMYIDNFGVILMVYSSPIFITKFFGEDTQKIKKISLFFALLEILMMILFNLEIEKEFVNLAAKFIMFLSPLISAVIGIKHKKNLIDENLKRNINRFFKISMLFIPLILLESFREKITILRAFNFFELFSLPMYFVVINIFNMYLGLKYLNIPPSINKEKLKLSDYFIEKYKITEREEEIIINIIQGLTYKEIAEKLCIAYKTVDNHIQNIYQKMEIKNKQQLKSIIVSNS